MSARSLHPVVGILGAGTMGGAIARLLISKGFTVRLHVRSQARAQTLADLASSHRRTPHETAAGADFVLSVVSDDAASKAVWFGPDGACSGAAPGTPCLEMSTLSTVWTDEWISRLMTEDLIPIDCPVTGSRKGAENGSLVGFVGAPRGATPQAEALLAQITRKCIHFERAGDAMRFKLAYNTIGAGICASFAEGLAMIEEAGLNMETALSALEEGAWTAAIAKSKGRSMAARIYDPVGFRTSLMLKDLEYSFKSLSSSNVQRRLGEAVRQLFAKACEKGFGDNDFTAVLEAVSKGNTH